MAFLNFAKLYIVMACVAFRLYKVMSSPWAFWLWMVDAEGVLYGDQSFSLQVRSQNKYLNINNVLTTLSFLFFSCFIMRIFLIVVNAA
jgi:hypothetical protein